MNKIFVGKNQKINTLQAAIDSLEGDEKVTILLEPGIYHEKVELRRNNVVIEGTGDSPEDTVISFDDYAFDLMPGTEEKRGTFRSYTMLVNSNDVTLEKLTIENASGDSNTHGQAIALYAEGDNISVINCRLLGHQDTLFTGPLPPKEVQPGGFIGPTQFAERIVGTQMYEGCYICGDVDFIFGSARAYFDDCVIESLRRDFDNPEAIQGYCTAASTYEGEDLGYLFRKCSFVSKDCPEESVYLGRPWRDHAKTEFVDCTFGKHIKKEMFCEWSGRIAQGTTYYNTSGCCWEK